MFKVQQKIMYLGKARFSYFYDVGDCCRHELVLEENHYFIPELRTDLVCLDSERACWACSPGNVYGVLGYFEFCNTITLPLTAHS